MNKIICPSCRKEMKEFQGAPKKAFCYDDCLRRCIQCEIGASNSKTNPTFIFKDYHKNIPSDLLDNLDYTLNLANNVRNRNSKKVKIGYSTSEDALTWIFLKHFIRNNNFELLKDILHIEDKIQEILIWGVPQINHSYKSNLKEVCIELGENTKSFSEPDVIIISDSIITFIEVKLKSSNERQSSEQRNYDKYLNNHFYKDNNLAKKSEYYELIRNWTIAHLIDTNKIVRLINLAPKKLFYQENDSFFQNFKNSLNNSENFLQLSWESIITVLNNSGEEDLSNQIRNRLSIL